MNTRSAAEHMLRTKKFYTAALLGAELGVSAQQANNYLYNIRNAQYIVTEETPLPGRKIRVLSIAGRANSKTDFFNYFVYGKKLENVA